VHIPQSDVIIATLGTESAYLAAERRGDISNDATDNDILDVVAFRAIHGTYLLTEVPPALIYFCSISTITTTIYMFPSHILVQR